MKLESGSVSLTRLSMRMPRCRQVLVVSSIIGLLLSACGLPNQRPSSTAITATAQVPPAIAFEQATVTSEVVPSDTLQAQTIPSDTPQAQVVPSDTPQAVVDLSAWGASSVAKYSPDGSLLAVTDSFDIHIYDPVTLVEINSFPGEVKIFDFAFSSDNNILSVAHYDYLTNAFSVQQLAISTGAEISNAVVLDIGDDYSDVPTMGSVSPDGTTFALIDTSMVMEGGSTIVRVWDVASGQELPSISEGGPTYLVFSPDSKILLVCNLIENRNGVTLWDVASGNKTQVLDVLNSHQSIYSLRAAFSMEAGILAVAATYDYVLDDSYTVMLLDIGTGDELLSFDVTVEPSMAGHPVFALTFSNDGTMLATGSAKGIKIWDATTGNELQSIDIAVKNNVYINYSLTFSPNNAALILGSEDLYQVIMWDVATGEQLAP